MRIFVLATAISASKISYKAPDKYSYVDSVQADQACSTDLFKENFW